MRVRRERLWTNYYQLRASAEFEHMWKTFLHESGANEASPILYQYLTDKIMNKLIHKHFHFESPHSSENRGDLDYFERNALRYAAGFVIRSLQKKIDRSAHPLKKSVKLCLKDLEEDEGMRNM